MKTVSPNRLIRTTIIAAALGTVAPTDALAWWCFGGHCHRSYSSWNNGGSWGSYGSSGSYGSWGSNGSSDSYNGSDDYGRYDVRRRQIDYPGYASYPATEETATESGYSTRTDLAPPPAPNSGAEAQATIRLSVPADAQVFVDNQLTATTGAERRYVSRGLREGQTYAYQVRVEFNRSGERIVENKLVRVSAGDEIALALGATRQLADNGPATTELTLHVPQDAKVTLDGAATGQTGEVRTYATSSLARGKTWDNYVVRVQLEKDGQTLVEEQALKLVGGERHELKIDFADESVKLAALDGVSAMLSLLILAAVGVSLRGRCIW